MDNTPYSIDAKDLEWVNAVKAIALNGGRAIVERIRGEVIVRPANKDE